MNITEDALQAALLAKMVGLELKEIDNSTTDRTSTPALRIKPESFLNANLSTAHSAQPAIMYQQPVDTNIPQYNPTPAPANNVDLSDLKDEVKIIRYNLEKINSNLTKMAGMFGKVFHNLNKITDHHNKND